MKTFSPEEIEAQVAAFRQPERAAYPELESYTRDQLYQDCFGGGGLYLAARMARTLKLQPGEFVLDLGCGKGPASVFLAQHYGVRVVAVDLWTTATFLNDKFTALGLRERILPLQLDVTQPLPFAENYFDAVFCMNSFNFYGGSQDFLPHLLKHLKPGGRLCLGSEVLSAEFTPEQLAQPPEVYAFKLPPPNENVDVFTGDFIKQHTPAWWRDLFERSGLLDVEVCQTLEDEQAIYEEMVWYEHTHRTDPFDVQMCLNQFEWGRNHQPHKSLYILAARKR